MLFATGNYFYSHFNLSVQIFCHLRRYWNHIYYKIASYRLFIKCRPIPLHYDDSLEFYWLLLCKQFMLWMKHVSDYELTLNYWITELAILKLPRLWWRFFCTPTREIVLRGSTLWVKKTSHYTFACNFAKCWPIFKILSLTDSVVNLHKVIMIHPPHLRCVTTDGETREWIICCDRLNVWRSVSIWNWKSLLIVHGSLYKHQSVCRWCQQITSLHH